MEKSHNLLGNFQQFVSGGVYGILSVVFGMLGDLIAYLMYPGYNFTNNPVSSLCNGPGGMFFQVGTVLSGIFAILFVLYFIGSVPAQNAEKLRKIALLTALISCISFISLGVFCGREPTIALIHGVSAVISWISGICYITLFNIFMLRNSKYSKLLVYFGFGVSLTLSTMVLMFFLYYFLGLHIVIIILPLLEWIDTFILAIWYLIISIFLILKKI
ncbi:hypothetical protein LCGC14_0493160 [marine sediment metagenome]|uniref:DUF998 domain-containing protein n=1 Tax=marine sediment metagenome TaxID=412755 RepID=A0A0F9USZ3_9ZZZZ|nr:MAG: hypothetical protein Lokiarch_32310 [Candidatus Lokiarchaeum sp. GC14_75]